MFIFSERRPRRVRVACIENADAPRDTVVIGFELDRSQPGTDADRIYEAMQFVWQMVPSVLADSSLHALHIEVAVNSTSSELVWDTIICKEPLASIELVHYVLNYSRRLAELSLRQTPRVPIPKRWDNPTQQVLDTLNSIRNGVFA